MGSATLKALERESNGLLGVLATCSSKGSKVVCPILEESLVVLSQALMQPKLVQHVGFTLQRVVFIVEHPWASQYSYSWSLSPVDLVVPCSAPPRD